MIPSGRRLDRRKGEKMKRYVVECSNDFIHACEKIGSKEQIDELNRVRNNYICGFLSEVEALKELVEIVERRY